jgi:hypothetical protein
MQALSVKETQDETQFTTKIVEKLVWVPITCLMPCYAETGRSRPIIA